MFEAKVTIGLKKGVSDPEGVNTLKALKLLGFDLLLLAGSFPFIFPFLRFLAAYSGIFDTRRTD